MSASRARSALTALLTSCAMAAGSTACVKDPPTDNSSKPAPSASASTATATNPAPLLDAGMVVTDATAPRLACRAIAVVAGDGGGGALMLKVGDLMAEEAFLDLEPGARITTKHPRTTREMTVVGPAHARFCVGFEDETWLASGTFKSSAGSGEAPGTEAWIVTPYGVARYSAGSVSAKVDSGLEVTVTSGVAHVWSGEPSSDGGTNTWEKVATGTVKARGGVTKEPLDARSAKREVARCRAAADAARSLAISMTPDGGPPTDLARLAGEHVVARREGRAACGVARLRVALLPPSDERTLLSSAVEEAAHWSALR
ncbi:MAG: hypothetical protein JWM74_5961 [Myxococcaceae bacterium]|nr:hypothetical protein [Myxococcaceae bacterium]